MSYDVDAARWSFIDLKITSANPFTPPLAAAPNLVKIPFTTFAVHPHELGNPETSMASGRESLARLWRAAATLKAGSSMPLLEFDPEATPELVDWRSGVSAAAIGAGARTHSTRNSKNNMARSKCVVGLEH